MRAFTFRKLWLLVPVIVVVAVAFDVSASQGRRAVNTPVDSLKWEAYAPGSPLQVAPLWGDRTKPGEYAILLKMPAGLEAGRHSHTNDYHGLTIQGTWVHTNDGDSTPHELGPGGFAFQPGKQVHNDVCKGTTDCIVLIHQMGPGDFIPAKTP